MLTAAFSQALFQNRQFVTAEDVFYAIKNSKVKIKQCIITLGLYSLNYDLSLSSSKYKCVKTYVPLFGDSHHAPKAELGTEGEVWDVAVDLRKGSPTYGQWEGVYLSAENKRQFYVPEGFAHGFVVLSETATFNYKCTDFYSPEHDGGLLWNDEDVAVEWPLDGIEEVLLSEKDKNQKTFKELDLPFVYK